MISSDPTHMGDAADPGDARIPGMAINLNQCAVLLGAAVLAVSIFRLLKLSSILGYVAAGMVIGPWGFRLVKDVESVLSFSEFGIVLLLFIIGLELQPTRLWVMRRIVFGMGSAQVVVCAILLGLSGWLLGLQIAPALLVGFGLSLSSTPLVLQLLAERAQLKSSHGRAAFGILLFQAIPDADFFFYNFAAGVTFLR